MGTSVHKVVNALWCCSTFPFTLGILYRNLETTVGPRATYHLLHVKYVLCKIDVCLHPELQEGQHLLCP